MNNTALSAFSITGDINNLTAITIDTDDGHLCFGHSTDLRFPIQDITLTITNQSSGSGFTVSTGGECYFFRGNVSECTIFQVTVKVNLDRQLNISRDHFLYSDHTSKLKGM